jgi:hypothetical protein
MTATGSLNGNGATTGAYLANRIPPWLPWVCTVLAALCSGILLLVVEYKSGLFIRPEPPLATETPHATREEVVRLRALLEEATGAVAEARRQAALAERAKVASEQAALADPLAQEAADARRKLRQVTEALHGEVADLRGSLEEARKEARETAARLWAAEERLTDLRARHESELARARQEVAKVTREKEEARVAADSAAQEASRSRVDAAVARSAPFRPLDATLVVDRPSPAADHQRRPYPVDQYPNTSGYYGWRGN